MSATAVPQVPPAPITLMTAEEFTRRYENGRAELVRGQVEELPMPFPKHGSICNETAFYLTSHVKANDLGRVVGNDSFVLTHKDPDTTRGADICYWSYERLPKGPIPDGLIHIAPDLVIEVRSPSDRWTKVFAKVIEYLEAGVRVVIVLDPETATASVYRPDELQQIHDNGDELTLPDVLPGFRVAVKKFFE